MMELTIFFIKGSKSSRLSLGNNMRPHMADSVTCLNVEDFVAWKSSDITKMLTLFEVQTFLG